MKGECDIGGTLPGVSEIDRLRKLWIKAHDRIVQQDVIIETMNEAHKVLIAEKDVEIERLKSALVKAYSDVTYQRTLITELCDALFDMAPDPYDDFFGPLIQRAREATR